MDLELTPEQHDVATSFEQVLSRESSIERVRAVQESGFDPRLWKVLTELDAVAVALPEGSGGMGSGTLELSLVAEAVGRHVCCVPLPEAAVAAMLLARVGGHDEVFARALSGGAPVVFCPRPAVDGVARVVPGGAVAAAVVALDAGELVLVQGTHPGAAHDLGFQAATDRPLHGARVERTVLAGQKTAAELWDLGLGWWRLAAAAACSGVAEKALDVAVAYASTREQFGVPIGSFQAIQHALAQVVLEVDSARLLVREAAWRHDHGVAAWRRGADIAFAHAAATAVRSAETCLHVHGGYGYSLEYDAQLYLRRAKAILLQGGDPEDVFESIGAVTLEGAS